MKIKDIAQVTSGLVVARKKAIIEKDVVKGYKQLNLRSINKKGYIDKVELERLAAKEEIDLSYMTKQDDIIVRLTDPFTAVYISKENERLVVTSNFCIIRCTEKYNSKFLSFYLNSENAKKELLNNLQGSIIKNISMTSVAELTIPNIDKEKQILLGKLFFAQMEKIKCMERLIQLEEKKQTSVLKRIDEMEI